MERLRPGWADVRLLLAVAVLPLRHPPRREAAATLTPARRQAANTITRKKLENETELIPRHSKQIIEIISTIFLDIFLRLVFLLWAAEFRPSLISYPCQGDAD